MTVGSPQAVSKRRGGANSRRPKCRSRGPRAAAADGSALRVRTTERFFALAPPAGNRHYCRVGATWWASQREQNRRNVLHFEPHYMRRGLIFGGIMAVFMAWLALSADSWLRAVYVLGAVVGALTAWMWWLFLRWRRHFDSTLQ